MKYPGVQLVDRHHGVDRGTRPTTARRRRAARRRTCGPALAPAATSAARHQVGGDRDQPADARPLPATRTTACSPRPGAGGCRPASDRVGEVLAEFARPVQGGVGRDREREQRADDRDGQPHPPLPGAEGRAPPAASGGAASRARHAARGEHGDEEQEATFPWIRNQPASAAIQASRRLPAATEATDDQEGQERHDQDVRHPVRAEDRRVSAPRRRAAQRPAGRPPARAARPSP